jgi:transcription-repair coupling factor (superfamily II helicase)
LKRLYPGAVIKDVAKMILVPRPRGATVGDPAPRDAELLDWCAGVVKAIFTD